MSTIALASNTLVGTPSSGQIEYNGQFFGTDSNASRGQLQRIAQATSVASTSGTSIDFTSIPSWVKRITVMFNGVSTSGTSLYQIQLGSGSVTTTGYISGAMQSTTFVSSTAGMLLLGSSSAASVYYGNIIISNITSNTWTSSSVLWNSAGATNTSGGTSPNLSGALDRVRITTVNGTDTFDAGSINIMYEG
jgi:hypothetical protein